MEKEFIMATAKTIEQQILWSINKWEYLSWGIKKKVATEYEGMATLALRVSGAVHKGWVFISLNEGKDCYEVRLLNVARTKVKRTLDEVYCDNLGQVLDGLIERKAEWTDAQYNDKAARDSARKTGMEVIDVSKKTAEPMVIDNDNNEPNNKEDKTMKMNLSNKNNESGNVQNNAQVNDEPIVRQVDVMGLMGALKRDGHAKLSDHVIEDADAEEVKDEQAEEIESVNVGEVTLSSIMPKMTPASLTPNPSPARPLDACYQRDARRGEENSKGEGSTNTGKTDAAPKPETKAARYQVQLLPSKSGGVWPKLYGFKDEKSAKAVAEKMPSSVTARWDYGMNGEGRETKTRHWHLKAGKRYCGVMQELADALNKGDRVAVANAAAKACGVYAGAVAENKSKNSLTPDPGLTPNPSPRGEGNFKGEGSGKTEPKAKAETKTEPAPAMGNEEQAMFELFKKFMAGDKAAMAKVNEVLKAA